MAVLLRAQDQGLPNERTALDHPPSAITAEEVAEPALESAVSAPPPVEATSKPQAHVATAVAARATSPSTERATPSIERHVAERPRERPAARPAVVATPSLTPTATAAPVSSATPMSSAAPTPTAKPTPAVHAVVALDAQTRNPIVQFDATATRLARGQQTYICVGIDSGAAASVTGIGRIPAGMTTCHRIAPKRTTAYVLRVRAGAATASRTITVTVVPTPAAVTSQPSVAPTHTKYTVGT